jgi:glycosyltransferase involved in cell wall biosynthesis
VLLGSGPREAALKEQVRSRNLGDRVYFLPRVPFGELHSYTCSADLGLCLIKGAGRSFYHSLPNKLFEYLMAGLPVLASDFPEMRAVVEESGAGLVANPQDLRDVREKVRAVLTDPLRRRTYGQAALAAARHYNWEQEAPRLLALYAGL